MLVDRVQQGFILALEGGEIQLRGLKRNRRGHQIVLGSMQGAVQIVGNGHVGFAVTHFTKCFRIIRGFYQLRLETKAGQHRLKKWELNRILQQHDSGVV